jgi:hypothetical protein
MSLRGIPLLILALIIYNAIVFASSLAPQEIFYGMPALDAAGKAVITKGGQLLSIPLPSGTVHIRLGDALIGLGIILMGFEMVKATYTRGFGLVDRLLSPLLFVLFLVEFLLVPRCATSVFFFLTVMAGFDVVVGEVVGIRSAGRNINFGGNN